MSKRTTILKISIFGSFIVGSIVIGILSFLYPPIPTKWDGAPYSVTLIDLQNQADLLENEQIVITGKFNNYNYDQLSNVLTIDLRDGLHDVNIQLKFFNWSNHSKYSSFEIRTGISYSVRGISLINSKGYVLGLDIVQINSNITSILSLIGLGVIVPLIFLYFRVDLKRLKITPRSRKKSKGGLINA